MNEHNLVPNIRFKDFDDKWKLSKLGNDLISIHTGTNLIGTEENGGTPLIKMGNLKNGFFDFSKLDYLPIGKNVKDEDKVGFGDFLFNTRNTLDLVGKGATWMYKSTKFAYNSNIAKFNFRNSINTFFFNYLYNTYNVMNQVHSRATGTTSVAAIYPKSLDSIIYNLPGKQEQQKIGEFFTKLDKLLDLQQQKINKLDLLKKALLQKLFPKHDAKIPELRFKGYKNEWEEQKLRIYIERVSGNDGRMNLPTLTISASKGWMNQNERFSNNIAGKEQKNYTLLKRGELSYNHGNSKLFKYGVVYELVNYDEALVPKVYHSFRVNSKASARFIEYLFRGKKVDRELRKLVTSGARMDGLLNISFNNFENIQLYFPEKAEQKKVSNLLSKVDQLIELENKKLHNLQQVKKCLLQNMFVE